MASIIKGDVKPIPNTRVHRLFEQKLESSEVCSTEVALDDNSTPISYGYLNERANTIAWNLVKLMKGRKPVEIHEKTCFVVGLSLPPSPERLMVVLGMIKAGLTYIPIDTSMPIQRTKFLLENSHACSIITSDWTTTTNLFKNSETNVPVIDVASIMKGSKSSGNLKDEEEVQACKDIGSPIAIIYTSGTTGNPKATPISHRNVLNAALYVEETRIPQKHVRQTSFFNIMSIAFPVELFAAWFYGHTLCIFPDETKTNVVSYSNFVKTMRVNRIFSITPTFLQNLAVVAKASGENPFHNVSCVGCGAEIVSPLVIKNLLEISDSKCTCFVIWGMTETTMHSIIDKTETLEDLQSKERGGKAPIGTPSPNMNVYIVDENMGVVPEGKEGELAISGLSLSEGYIFTTKTESFVKNKILENVIGHETIFLTGDYAFIQDGRVYFTGRNIARLIVRGWRVSAVEIDEIVMKLNGVQKAATIGYSLKDDDTVIVTYYTLKPDSTVSSKEIIEHCKKYLPEYAIPKPIRIEELPVRLPQNKVDYPALHELYSKQISSGITDTYNRKDIRQEVVKIIAKIVGVSPKSITSEQDIYELGVNSANAVQIWGHLKKIGLITSFEKFLTAHTVNDIVEPTQGLSSAKYIIEDFHALPEDQQLTLLEFITNSFYKNRYSVLNKLFPLPYEDYHQITLDAYKLAKKDRMSYYIRNKENNKIEACGFLLRTSTDEDHMKNTLEKGKVDHIYHFLNRVEGPFIKVYRLLPGETLFGARFAVDPSVSNKDSACLSTLGIQYSIDIARAKGFSRIHFATMHPGLQATLREKGVSLWGEVHMKSFEVDGSFPFADAPDDVVFQSVVLEIPENTYKSLSHK